MVGEKPSRQIRKQFHKDRISPVVCFDKLLPDDIETLQRAHKHS